MDPRELRIGDEERDDALSLLQGHLTAGRLEHDEFDERVGKALAARRRGDLDDLFLDLPGRRPGGELVPVEVSPDPTPTPETHEVEQRGNWWGAWWMIFPVLAIAGGSRQMWLVPVALVWLFWIYPSFVAPRTRRPAIAAEPRALTVAERGEITREIESGKKIQAIKRYREITGADLRTAKEAVERWDPYA